MTDLLDFTYYAELGEIVTNVFAAVRRGDVKADDVSDYLKLITELTARPEAAEKG